MNGLIDFVATSVTCAITAICFRFVIDTMAIVWCLVKEKLGIGNDENR